VKEFYITIQGRGAVEQSNKKDTETHGRRRKVFSWKGSEGWVGILPN
jgi:hypothetical protein